MFTLKLEERDKNLNGKQLRRQGILPAVLYGKHMEESISVQLSMKDAEKFYRYNFIGSKVELEFGGEKHLAILKEATLTPAINKLEHLSFQALMAGEKVKSVANIIVTGKEKVREGIVMQVLDEISYIALPVDIVDRIEVNVSKMKVGEVLTLDDLDFVHNENVEILTPLDSVIVTVNIPKMFVEETEEGESAETKEPELVSDHEHKEE